MNETKLGYIADGRLYSVEDLSPGDLPRNYSGFFLWDNEKRELELLSHMKLKDTFMGQVVDLRGKNPLDWCTILENETLGELSIRIQSVNLDSSTLDKLEKGKVFSFRCKIENRKFILYDIVLLDETNLFNGRVVRLKGKDAFDWCIISENKTGYQFRFRLESVNLDDSTLEKLAEEKNVSFYAKFNEERLLLPYNIQVID